MKTVGEQCAGNLPALFDEGALGNARTLLYCIESGINGDVTRLQKN